MHKIKLTDSLQAAHAVLARLNKLLPQRFINDESLWIESYSNGREQGLCLKYYPRGACDSLDISFSAYRSSDSIVVYHGTNFSMQGNLPSEKAYKNSTTFHNLQDAAEHIVDLIKQYTPSNAELFIREANK